MSIRESGIHTKCVCKQEHMTEIALHQRSVHIWQTEAWRAAKGCAYNGLTSADPGVCCFTHKKAWERKCIRTAKLMALNPPRIAVFFQPQPRGWWIPRGWALSFAAVGWRKIKGTVFQFQEGCQRTSPSFPKPSWLVDLSSLFHALFKKNSY